MPLQPVAIVGIAADLPSGSYADGNLDHKQFFDFLLDKGESYETIPADRFNLKSWHGKALGQVNTTAGSFLKDVGLFDNLEFGISNRDVRSMSLSTRKLLELSFLSLLDSGIDYRGRNVGCYMSGVAFDIMSAADPDEFEARGSFAGIPAMIANRVSYHLDLVGPSIPTDTACSSSLTALHMAVQALRSRDCESAIVGGCQLNHRFVDFVQYSQGSVLAPDGKCKPFDAGADGFSRGEGAVVVVVKLLEDAIRDGDHIYASILGTGINSAGQAAPAGAPVAAAQLDAMRRAYRDTGRSPSEVDFIELHATGTAAGDPTEANWVGAEFQRDDELIVGSVKGNIGHLEITSFLASLSKVCSMLETGLVPPTVNCRTLNPKIRWQEYKLRVPTETEPLKARSSSKQPLISMCSSGIGGANGHIVLEGPPLHARYTNGVYVPEAPILFVAGGLTPRAAAAVSDTMAGFLKDGRYKLAKWSTWYGRRARQMTWRSFAVSMPGKESMDFSPPILSPRNKSPVVFVFSGQGPQHINMGRQLFHGFTVFRESILEMDAVYKNVVGESFIQQYGIFDNVESLETLPDIWPVSATLPAIAMIQIALVDLLSSIGIRPDIIVGHSAGETAMMYASGAASKAMVVEIAIARGQTMSLAEGQGYTMAALSCGPKKAQGIIDAVTTGDGAGKVEIACYNDHEAVTLSGLITYIDQAIERAEKMGILGRKLKTGTPVHSSMMEVCRESYQQKMLDIFARYPGEHRPKVTTYSTVHGNLFTDPFTTDYMWENTRHPVRFTQAITSILTQASNASFVEISPHPVLSSYLSNLGAPSTNITCPMRRSRKIAEHDEAQTFLTSVGRLAAMGHNIDFVALNGRHTLAADLDVPPYPFAKRFVPYYPELSTVISKQIRDRNGPLNHPDLRINTLTHPELAQHIIKGEPIMPAAGYVEMALEYGAKMLWDVEFRSIMSLSNEKPVPVEIVVEDSHWAVKSSALAPGFNDVAKLRKRLHAEGYMSFEASPTKAPRIDIDAIRSRCQNYDLEDFYETLAKFAEYGPAFQRVTECYRAGDETLIKVRGADVDLPDADQYVMHPAILDACIHATVHPAFTLNGDPNVYYLPSRIELVRVHEYATDKQYPAETYAYFLFRKWLPDALVYDVLITNSDGECMLELKGVTVAAHTHALPEEKAEGFDMIHQPFSVDSLSENLPPLIKEDTGAHATDANSDAYVLVHKANRDTLQDKFVSPNSDVSETSSEEAFALIDNFKNCESCITDMSASLRTVLHHLRICKRVIRILELGAEQGQLSEYAFAIADEYPDLSVECFVADVTLEGAQRAARALARRSVRPIAFDASVAVPEHSPIPIASFDLIFGFHAPLTLDGASEMLAFLNTALVPGGVLLLQELDRNLPSTPLPNDMPVPTLEKGPQWEFLRQTNCDHVHQPACCVLVGQKTPLPSLPFETESSGEDIWIQEYVVGDEMYIQSAFDELMGGDNSTLWLTAVKGIDGDGALGFSRSLRHEFPTWRIVLVVFDSVWSQDQQADIISSLSRLEGLENELLINEAGRILLPRFVPLPATRRDSFHVDKLWTKIGAETVRQVANPAVPKNHVAVSVDDLSNPDDCIYGLVGRVLDAGHSSLPMGARVTTLTFGNLSNFAVVHEGSLAIVPDDAPAQIIVSAVVGVVAVIITLGQSTIQEPARLAASQIIVVDDSSPISKSIVSFANALGLEVVCIAQASSVVDISAAKIRPRDVLFARDLPSSLRSCIPAGVRCFAWSTLPDILASDPWSIGDALRLAVNLPQAGQLEGKSFTTHRPEDFLPISPALTAQQQLLDPKKAYVLIGGIGSLGMQITLWMYRQGARHIVLTSRTGRQSLVRLRNVPATRILAYLETLPDLDLRLEASDATSQDELHGLFDSINQKIGGCMILSAALSDKTFMAQTAEGFDEIFAAKKGVFETLEATISIDDLDFLVALSSVATFGNAGQTNYSSANTALDGLTRKYRNAFSMVTPALLDTALVSGNVLDYGNQGSRLRHLTAWGTTCQRLCQFMADGIRKLSQTPFGIYIPNIDWDILTKFMGPSPLYNHLLSGSHMTTSEAVVKNDTSLVDLVLEYLDVTAEDFSPDIPLTTYGLDSIFAARLTHALRPYIAITQVQLLADISFNDLKARIEESQANGYDATKTDADESGRFNWQELHKPGQALVKLIDEGGVPMILIHGATGSILAFKPMQDIFKGSLWALQTTPEAPQDSLRGLARFYFDQIKRERPEGPYRLGAYSGTNLIAMLLAQLVQAAGDEIAQMVFLDHSPLLFTSCLYEMDEETLATRKPSKTWCYKAIETMADCQLRDPSDARKKLGHELMNRLAGKPPIEDIGNFFDMAEVFAKISGELLIELAGDDFTEFNVKDRLVTALTKWCEDLRAERITVVVASNGILGACKCTADLDAHRKEWEDLGASRSLPQADVFNLDGSHISMFGSKDLARCLEEGWRGTA